MARSLLPQGTVIVKYNNLKVLPINVAKTISWADRLGSSGVPLA